MSDLYSPTHFRVLKCTHNKTVKSYRQAYGECVLTLSADAPTCDKVALLVFAAYSVSIDFGSEVFPLQRIEIPITPGQIDVTAEMVLTVPHEVTLEVFGLTKEGRLLTDENDQIVGFAESINFDTRTGQEIREKL